MARKIVSICTRCPHHHSAAAVRFIGATGVCRGALLQPLARSGRSSSFGQPESRAKAHLYATLATSPKHESPTTHRAHGERSVSSMNVSLVTPLFHSTDDLF